jgi:hypothetical protein
VSRVGQVALQTGGHQGCGQSLQQRAGNFEVGFGVLEANGVDLVGHCRGSGRTGFGNLGEVADGNVGPDVSRQVVQDAVGVRNRGEEFRGGIVGLNLSSQRIPGEAKSFDKVLAHNRPVDIPGSATTWAENVPVAPENLAR